MVLRHLRAEDGASPAQIALVILIAGIVALAVVTALRRVGF